MSTERSQDQAWDMVVTFFQAKRLFEEQYRTYETQVHELSLSWGVHRSELSLEADEVSRLLDLSSLNVLVSEYLCSLREISNEIHSGAGSRELFDYYVTNIFHEISILKEEHHEVKQYGPEDQAPQEGEEYNLILEEVHEYFPKRIHRCYKLFQKAQGRLLELLPDFRENKVFVRSLYVMGHEVLASAYDGNLVEFYGRMYTGGIVEGLVEVARSFFSGGFHDLAVEALSRANEQVEAGLLPDGCRDGVAAKVAEMEKLLASA